MRSIPGQIGLARNGARNSSDFLYQYYFKVTRNMLISELERLVGPGDVWRCLVGSGGGRFISCLMLYAISWLKIRTIDCQKIE